MWGEVGFVRYLCHVMFDEKSAKAAFPSRITLGKGFARCIPRHATARRSREKIAR
jgi:hypothetical protein